MGVLIVMEWKEQDSIACPDVNTTTMWPEAEDIVADRVI